MSQGSTPRLGRQRLEIRVQVHFLRSILDLHPFITISIHYPYLTP